MAKFMHVTTCYKILAGISTERLGIQLSQTRDMFHKIEKQNVETMAVIYFVTDMNAFDVIHLSILIYTLNFYVQSLAKSMQQQTARSNR